MREIVLFLCIVFVQNGLAQTITLEFPKFAGKTYDFIIFQGDKQVKVKENDTIPKNGIFNMVIPKEYTPYTGMCRWLITNTTEGGGLDIAIPGFGYKVTCFSDKPNSSNIQWQGYDAMNELERLNRIQQQIIDKFETMSKATKLYDSKYPLYTSFVKEKEVQQNAYESFQKDLKRNSNYNARILPIVNLLSGLSPKLTDDYEIKAKYVNEYITRELNFDHLYTSGYWGSIIQSWVQLQTQMLNNVEGFKNDFNLLSERIVEPKKYTDFVGKITYYLTQYGKDDFIDAIAPKVIGSGKITAYEGKTMQVYVKALMGTQAPDLVIKEHIGKVGDHNHKTTLLKSAELASGSYKKTILIFYQSGCGPCEELMQQLPSHYEMLKSKGFRIISLSADEGEQLYKNASKDYPWIDKYCDFEGKNSINFKNYAVIGTPSIYVLDKTGKIDNKLATLKEILELTR